MLNIICNILQADMMPKKICDVFPKVGEQDEIWYATNDKPNMYINIFKKQTILFANKYSLGQ